MKLTLNTIILGIIILSLIAIPTTAFFPDTHYFQLRESIKEPINSELYSSCAKHPDVCYSGDILADVSVLFYFTSFTKYAATHSPSFCQEMLKQANGEIENACAVGACLHQTQDLHSHNEMVKYSIEHSLLPNSIIHPMAEQHMDNLVNTANPEVHQERLQATETFEQCVPLFKKVMAQREEYRGVNLDKIFDKFVAELEGSKTGYDASFNNLSSIPIAVLLTYSLLTLFFITLTIILIMKRLRYKERRTIINWITLVFFLFMTGILIFVFIANIGGQAFNSYVAIIKPISNAVPLGGHNVDIGIQEGRNFLEKGVPHLTSLYDKGFDPSGGKALAAADRSIIAYQYIFGGIIGLLLIGLIYLNFRTKKQSSRGFRF